jgi:hypothetical protein
MFDSMLFPITEFDALPPDKSTELLFEFDEFTTEADEQRFNFLVPSQAQDLGYEMFNSILLLGSGLFVILYYFAQVLVVLPLCKL